MFTSNVFLFTCIVLYVTSLCYQSTTCHHPQSNSLYSSEELTTLQANNNPNTLNTRSFHPAVLLQNLPRARRKSPQSYGNKHHLLYLSLILILQSADCEQNPGPRTPKYPCMICSKAVKWNQRAVACDNCEGWYHAECMNTNSQIYTALTKPDTSWICCSCGILSISTSLFESFNINESSNRFDSHTDSTSSFTCDEIVDPIVTSSPKSKTPPHKVNSAYDNILKVLTINFQSLRAKRQAFWNLVDSSKPDVILGCETWLRSTITTQEVMPPGYVTYRNDRSDGYGVLVAVKDTLFSSEVDIETKSELIAVQIEGEGKLPLIVASLYRLPNRNIEHMHTLCSDIHNLYEKFSHQQYGLQEMPTYLT